MNRDGSAQPPPTLQHRMPEPTFWPAVMAVAICFALWGILTSPWIIVAGVLGIVLAAAGWIGDLHDEPLA